MQSHQQANDPFPGYSSTADSGCKRLLIVGASARSAAQCAVRAGFQVWAADLFADRDLIECSHVLPLHELLDHDDSWWQPWQGSPLLLCGGTENQPELVDALMCRGLLCGLKRDSLTGLRSPTKWRRWAEESGIQWPESHDARAEPPCHLEPTDWLIKSSTSAGGLGVRACGTDAIRPGDYLQRRIEGDVVGVTFLSYMDQSLIAGCAQSWNSDRFSGPLPYIYRGSIGPIALNEDDSCRLHRFAEIVHDSTGLLGLWQADFIKNSDGWWLLEINPRWSSSMELLDSLSHVRLVSLHVQAISGASIQEVEFDLLRGFQSRESHHLVKPVKPRLRIGKVVRYAAVDIHPTEEMLQQWWSKRWCGDVEELRLENRLADIPNTTDTIATGYPMFTEFAMGDSVEEVQERFKRFSND